MSDLYRQSIYIGNLLTLNWREAITWLNIGKVWINITSMGNDIDLISVTLYQTGMSASWQHSRKLNILFHRNIYLLVKLFGTIRCLYVVSEMRFYSDVTITGMLLKTTRFITQLYMVSSNVLGNVICRIAIPHPLSARGLTACIFLCNVKTVLQIAVTYLVAVKWSHLLVFAWH